MTTPNCAADGGLHIGGGAELLDVHGDRHGQVPSLAMGVLPKVLECGPILVNFDASTAVLAMR
ncbi:hypothetical protein [Streptomyces sp. LN704]|uniref:hypothetical protein n=1 Tax=unclassified Streptomyces TaxID=2593676 RepID=UPI0037206DD8